MSGHLRCPLCDMFNCRGRCGRGFDAYYSRLDTERPLPEVDWDGDDRDDFVRFDPEAARRY